MFNWFKSKDNTIESLRYRIELLEAIDKVCLGCQESTDAEVYAIVNSDKSLVIKCEHMKFVSMPENCIARLRDFLVKNFPKEELKND